MNQVTEEKQQLGQQRPGYDDSGGGNRSGTEAGIGSQDLHGRTQANWDAANLQRIQLINASMASWRDNLGNMISRGGGTPPPNSVEFTGTAETGTNAIYAQLGISEKLTVDIDAALEILNPT